MAGRGAADGGAPPLRLDGGAVLRLGLGFGAGLFVWFAFSTPYAHAIAAPAERLLRAFESPAVTRLSVSPGEFRVDRADFPPDSPRPGLPASDLHFNFVILTALFALGRDPLSSRNVGRFCVAAAALWAIHVLALVFQIEALYATRLGPWSEAHYGAFARNFWAAGFHFYEIAGRFAAPFALWWGLGRTDGRPQGPPRA